VVAAPGAVVWGAVSAKAKGAAHRPAEIERIANGCLIILNIVSLLMYS
jgi:hypothetical protein